MLVGARMTYPVITIGPRATLADAKELIEKENVHSLPVVDRQGRLLGMITREILENPKPDAANPENVEPLVEDVMTQKVLTVTENTPIEEAARMITDYDIKSIPVVRGNFVVGIITANSLIRIFLELTGARKPGVRVTFVVANESDKLLTILHKVLDLGGSISTISTYCAEEKGFKMITLKITGVDKFQLKQEITPIVQKLIDIR